MFVLIFGTLQFQLLFGPNQGNRTVPTLHSTVPAFKCLDKPVSSILNLFKAPAGQKYTFTIQEGADGRNGRISVNYDGFIEDVSEGDILLVDGGMLSLKLIKKTGKDVVCEVVDGGTMGSRCVLCSIQAFYDTK